MADKLLIVWDRVGDYHRARVRALEHHCDPDTVFTADFGSSDTLYKWDNTTDTARHHVLSTKPVHERDAVNRIRAFRGLIREHQIRKVAIAGYGRLEYALFIILARLLGCRVTLFAESWYGDNAAKNRLKGAFVRAFCCSCFVSGVRARDHFHQRMRVPLERIRTGYSVVDNAHFQTSTVSPRPPVILCVARFSPEKNLGLLISAFLKSSAAETFHLRLIGGGPEEAILRERAGGSPRVEFMDWVRYGDLPQVYADARFFILPSRFEPWGLVVNEAMAAGLPVIVTSAGGCQPDLVQRGENGFVFPPDEETALIEILNRLGGLTDTEWLRMSEASQRIISGYDCAHWAKNLLASFD